MNEDVKNLEATVEELKAKSKASVEHVERSTKAIEEMGKTVDTLINLLKDVDQLVKNPNTPPELGKLFYEKISETNRILAEKEGWFSAPSFLLLRYDGALRKLEIEFEDEDILDSEPA